MPDPAHLPKHFDVDAKKRKQDHAKAKEKRVRVRCQSDDYREIGCDADDAQKVKQKQSSWRSETAGGRWKSDLEMKMRANFDS